MKDDHADLSGTNNAPPVTKVEDFSDGFLVHHIICGAGCVARASHGEVVVYYANSYERGIYDAAWFAKHPTSLQIINDYVPCRSDGAEP